MSDILTTITSMFSDADFMSGFSGYITFISRFILPILALVVVCRSAISLLGQRYQSEVWGYLSLPNGAKIQLCHWENIIGRAASSDVLMEYPSISRSHAAIIRGADGNWKIYDLGGKMGTLVRGKKLSGHALLRTGDVLTIGGVETVFVKSTARQEASQANEREQPGEKVGAVFTLVILNVFIAILCLQLCLNAAGDYDSILFSFAALSVMMWGSYIVTRVLDRVGFELETLAFFLSAIGFSIAASSDPDVLYKETICLIAGIFLYWLLGWFLRDLERARKLRWPIAAAGLILLAVNLVTAESIFGAKNWLSVGSISFQPSEFVKLCFVFAGAATLDRLFAKRNLVLFVAYAAVCVGCLVMMSDFGTAVVFFTAYLVIAFMRSGSFAAIILSGAGAVFAAFIAITAKPYIAARFATWGKAWADANGGGYQQTRTMAACASGGFFGLGAGKGWFKNIFAADTDMVFGMVSEELGLIIAFIAIASVIVMAFFAIRSADTARSTFYVIAACASVSIMMMQIILNVFGSLDILPFTGVTFPFVSKGGSSLMASWGLLAFIKASDTRQNASFAVKLPTVTKRRKKGENGIEKA